METLTSAWEAYAKQAALIPGLRDPLLGLPVITFLNAVNQAYFVRVGSGEIGHWARLWIVTFVLSVGGGSFARVLMGQQPTWVTDGSMVLAVTLAYYLVFHCYKDAFAKLYRSPQLHPVWRVVNALNTVTAVTAIAKAGSSLPLPSALPLAILGGAGGSLIAEFTNMLLLPRSVYMQPIMGPSPQLLLSTWVAALYYLLQVASVTVPVVGYTVPLAGFTAETTYVVLVTLATAVALGVSNTTLSEVSSKLLSYLNVSSIIEPSFEFTEADMREGAEDEDIEEFSWEPAPWPLQHGVFGYDVEEEFNDDVDFFDLIDDMAEDEEDEDEAEEGTAVVAASPAKAAASPAPSARKRKNAAKAASPAASSAKKAPRGKKAAAASPAPASAKKAPKAKARAGSRA